MIFPCWSHGIEHFSDITIQVEDISEEGRNTFITFVFFDTCAIKHRLGHVSIGNKGLKNSLFGFAKEREFQIRP